MTEKISEFPQGIEFQNSSMDPNVWGSIPYGFSEFFSWSHAHGKEKKNIFLCYQAQNLSAFLFKFS